MINSAYCAGFALAADYASLIRPTGYLLSLLFGTRIAVDSVWPNSHWACMHLLLNISLLESPGSLTMFKLAPFVGFSEPLPVVFGVNFRTLATEHFHIVAA